MLIALRRPQVNLNITSEAASEKGTLEKVEEKDEEDDQTNSIDQMADAGLAESITSQDQPQDGGSQSAAHQPHLICKRRPKDYQNS